MKIIKQNLGFYLYSDKEWYIDWHKSNTRHREDGPAIIWSYGDEFYYLNGKDYNNGMYWNEIHENY